ncbi:STAS domain-containing protein [Actinoplanes sp. CA-051413]|jgi:anti-anti-sigma factor|uniref:STAS domain-containing protein n=1 Tax=Actinoplanes sp. CA-051413 TaxID=3239899 RepID=UPI003D959348
MRAELLDQTVVLALSGAVVYQNPEQIPGAVRAAIVRWAPEAILLDLADVRVLDAAGIAALLDGHRAVSWAGISFALVNVDAFVMGQLRDVGVASLIRAQQPAEEDRATVDV